MHNIYYFCSAKQQNTIYMCCLYTLLHACCYAFVLKSNAKVYIKHM